MLGLLTHVAGKKAEVHTSFSKKFLYHCAQHYYKKHSLQRKLLAQLFLCKNYKRITLQNKFLGLFSCKKALARFLVKKHYKENLLVELFL